MWRPRTLHRLPGNLEVVDQLRPRPHGRALARLRGVLDHLVQARVSRTVTRRLDCHDDTTPTVNRADRLDRRHRGAMYHADPTGLSSDTHAVAVRGHRLRHCPQSFRQECLNTKTFLVNKACPLRTTTKSGPGTANYFGGKSRMKRRLIGVTTAVLGTMLLSGVGLQTAAAADPVPTTVTLPLFGAQLTFGITTGPGGALASVTVDPGDRSDSHTAPAAQGRLRGSQYRSPRATPARSRSARTRAPRRCRAAPVRWPTCRAPATGAATSSARERRQPSTSRLPPLPMAALTSPVSPVAMQRQ